jgi:molecular chaperone DnaK (HSP70)
LILGLDFGTSTTSISELDDLGKPRLLPIGFQGSESIPSLIAHGEKGDIYFGQEARNKFQSDSAISVSKSFKNFISHRPSVLADPDEDQMITLFLRFVFTQVAEQTPYDPLNDSSISLRVSSPAGWNWEQRTRLLKIITDQLGISVSNSEVVDEPSAASINFLSYLANEEQNSRTLVFDMGGGTLDIAVLEVNGTESHPTIKSASSEQIAGNKLDDLLVSKVLTQALERLNSSPAASSENLNELSKELANVLGLDEGSAEDLLRWIGFRVEDLKKSDLAQEQDASILNFLDFLGKKFKNLDYPHVPDFNVVITSAEFEELVYDFLGSTKPLLTRVIQESLYTGKNIQDLQRISWDEAVAGLDYVVLAGGMAHVGSLRNWIDDFLPGKRLDVYVGEPENLVATGLAPRTVIETDFVAVSNFRPNFHLALGDFIFLYAYTPLFNIRPGSDVGLFKKIFPLSDGWSPESDLTEIRKLSLTGKEVPVHEKLFFATGDLAPFKKEGFSVYPDGRLIGMDGVGTPISWNIFSGSKTSNQIQTSRGCDFCGKLNCPGICSN